MKIFLLALFTFFHPVNSSFTEQIKNTVWVSKMAGNHADTFSFLDNNFLIHHCSGLQETHHGSYAFSKDTLIIKERDQKNNEKAVYYRIKFLLKGDALYPYSHEELLQHQWVKSKVQMRKNYIFKKMAITGQV